MLASGVEVYEGQESPRPVNGQKCIRLIVRRDAHKDDVEAESLFREFAKALENSEYNDEFLLSIFRIKGENEDIFGVLPKIENSCEGIHEIRRYLSTYSEDVKVPSTI